MLDLCSRRHGALLKIAKGVRILHCNKSAKQNNEGQIPIVLAFIAALNNWGHIKFNSWLSTFLGL
jgi:hypothetical protein